jgi:AcrR family transcriptional regulator
MSMSQGEKPRLGLRERKKAKTRAAIQHEALRLFREQGYEETTIEQIADAAEVSQSTFYRYFPTKEDVVLWDEFDELLIEAFERQPSQLTPIQAMRGAFRAVFDGLTPEQWDEQRQRFGLVIAVPELRAATANQIIDTIGVAAEAIGGRVGRPADDFAVRTIAGAVIGVVLPLFLILQENPSADWVSLADEAFARLDAGLPLN